MPNWEKHFDRVYCVHYLPQVRKWARLVSELQRVGLWGNPLLSMRYTSDETRRFDECIRTHAKVRANNAGCVNLGLEALSILAEARAFKYRRILILENDVAFLKDLAEIEATFAAIPDDADVVQMDNFVVPGGQDAYRRMKAERRAGERFFDAGGAVFYSGACFALSANGVLGMLDEMKEHLEPPDAFFAPLGTNGFRRVVADRSVAVQLVYNDSITVDMWGVNSHHDGYVRSDVDYSLYNVPDGYGYGNAI